MGCDELLALGTALLGADVAVTSSSHDALLEIAAAGVTKATGLASLAERAGVAAAEVIAFGDMPNDLPMLEWAGWGVAVANAHPSVRAVVDALIRRLPVAGHEDGTEPAEEGAHAVDPDLVGKPRASGASVGGATGGGPRSRAEDSGAPDGQDGRIGGATR